MNLDVDRGSDPHSICSRRSATDWSLHEFGDEVERGLRGSLVEIREAGGV